MKKILIIDDEQLIVELIEDILNEKYQCIGFTNSFKALMKLKTDKFDLIITDIQMPILSGIDIIKKVKEVPILVVTGVAEDSAEMIWIKNSCNNKFILKKPFDVDELVDLVKELLD